jgi:PPP family 3-phenylpropionic acid transporter
MPKMEGGQSRSGKKLNLLVLRKDGELAGLIVFLLLLHTTLGFYYAFFPVLMNNMGAMDLISVNNLLQFCSEIVFVYFVTALVRRFGFDRLFVLAFLLTAFRLLLIGLIRTPAVYLAVNLVGGLGYSMCMTLFVLYMLKVPSELRTSAQMLVPITAHSLSRFFGGMLGGVLSDAFGISAVFAGAGLFDLCLTAAFLFWIRRTRALKGRLLM